MGGYISMPTEAAPRTVNRSWEEVTPSKEVDRNDPIAVMEAVEQVPPPTPPPPSPPHPCPLPKTRAPPPPILRKRP